MEYARPTRLSEKGIEELYETLAVFGVNTSRQIFEETTREIKSIVASNSAMNAAGAVDKLQQASGRLALFGVYAPRTMLREYRTAQLSATSRAALLKTLQAAEGEVEAAMGEYATHFGSGPKASGHALTAAFWPAVFSYAGAGCGLALTFSFSGAILGFVLGIVIWFLGLLALHRP